MKKLLIILFLFCMPFATSQEKDDEVLRAWLECLKDAPDAQLSVLNCLGLTDGSTNIVAALSNLTTKICDIASIASNQVPAACAYAISLVEIGPGESITIPSDSVHGLRWQACCGVATANYGDGPVRATADTWPPQPLPYATTAILTAGGKSRIKIQRWVKVSP